MGLNTLFRRRTRRRRKSNDLLLSVFYFFFLFPKLANLTLSNYGFSCFFSLDFGSFFSVELVNLFFTSCNYWVRTIYATILFISPSIICILLSLVYLVCIHRFTPYTPLEFHVLHLSVMVIRSDLPTDEMGAC